ncbi:MAG: ferritin family protein [Clostridia bacterium]
MGKARTEYDLLRSDWVLEEMLKVAMEDEKADREKYRRLARMAEKERDRKILFSIADDEGRHLKLLQILFRKLYGKSAPKPHIPSQRFGGFKEMIGKSIVSEHEGVLFYRELLGHLDREDYKTLIRQIMADEQRHGQMLEGIFERR